MNAELRQLLEADLKAAFGSDLPANPVAGARRFAEYKVVYIFRMASHFTRGLRGCYYRWRLRRLKALHSITLVAGTRIGPGFRIAHLGPVVIHGKATLGSDVTVSQGVTIGKIHAGPKAGVPRIGDHVYLAPNAVVLGNVQKGSFRRAGCRCSAGTMVARLGRTGKSVPADMSSAFSVTFVRNQPELEHRVMFRSCLGPVWERTKTVRHLGEVLFN